MDKPFRTIPNLNHINEEDLAFEGYGFEVSWYKDVWSWDFMPEGNSIPKKVKEENKLRYARMFVCGFGLFLEWRENEVFTKWNIKPPIEIRARTNSIMVDMLLRFLGPEMLEIIPDENSFEIKIFINRIIENERITKMIKDTIEFESKHQQ